MKKLKLVRMVNTEYFIDNKFQFFKDRVYYINPETKQVLMSGKSTIQSFRKLQTENFLKLKEFKEFYEGLTIISEDRK